MIPKEKGQTHGKRTVRRALNILLAATVVGAMVLLATGTAGATTPVSGCTDITTSGVYELDGDVTDLALAKGESCVTITASDVTFDGQGHTIDANASDNFDTGGVLVVSSVNVTVRDLTVTDWSSFGINYTNTDQARAINVNATGNLAGPGIVFESTSDLSAMRGSTVRNSTVNSNGGNIPGQPGIRFGDETRGQVEDFSVIGNNLSGNDIESGAELFGGTVADNNVEDGNIELTNTNIRGGNHTVTGNSMEDGEIELRLSDNNTVTNNYFAEGSVADVAIKLTAVNNTRVTGNNINGPGVGVAVSGLDFDPAESYNNTVANNELRGTNGIQISSGGNHTVKSNNITRSGSGQPGIRLLATENSTVTDNNLTGNFGRGVELRNLAEGSNNTVSENIISDSTQNGIELIDASGTSITSNEVTANRNGITISRSSNNSITDNSFTENEFDGIVIGRSDNNTLTGNTARDNEDSFSISRSSNNVVENLNIGASTEPDTTLDFEANNVVINGVSSPPTDPVCGQNIGRYVNATNTSVDSFLNLSVGYEDSDVSGVNESSLRMWEYDGSWSEVSGMNGVNEAENEVFANITDFTVFAPIAGCSDGTGGGAVSPVEGVSDALWTAVTADDGDVGNLSLSDLGNAIQEYQKNPSDADVDGAPITLSDLGNLIQYYQDEVV